MIEKIENFLKVISDSIEKLRKSKAARVSSSHKTEIKKLGKTWLTSISTDVRAGGKIDESILNEVDSGMEKLYSNSDASPRTSSYLVLLRSLNKKIQSDILIPIIKAGRSTPSLVSGLKTKIFSLNLSDDEKTYYDEAFRAAESECYKAAIVMIWCGAISRIQTKIYKEGLTRFNSSSITAKGVNTGLLKHFNKEFNLQHQTELPFIADRDLILVVSCMVALETGNTEALLNALETRNNCGHPSGYKVEEIHFLHFGTEVFNLILNNSKFN